MAVMAGARFNPGGAVVFVALVCVWQVAVGTAPAGQSTVAGPLDVVAEVLRPGVAADVVGAAGHTLLAALLGWIAAVVVGVVAGIGLGSSRLAWNLSMSSVDVLRALPPVALVAPLVLLLGFSLSMEVAVIFLGCVWPVAINTALGVQQIPAQLRETAATLDLPTSTTLTRVIVPSAAPMILVGARLALTLSIILAVVAEMVGNPAGIGYEIVFAQEALNPSALYLYIVTSCLLAVAANAVLVALARALPPIGRRSGRA